MFILESGMHLSRFARQHRHYPGKNLALKFSIGSAPQALSVVDGKPSASFCQAASQTGCNKIIPAPT